MAHRATVAQHVATTKGGRIAKFVEVESGRKRDRPQLDTALAACRKQRAVLLSAKLDRLARNVAFVSGLMGTGVEFVAAVMPTVNRLTIHILAAVAEEARMVSARTKAALAVAEARGVKLGGSGKALAISGPTRSRRARPARRSGRRRRARERRIWPPSSRR